MVLAAGEGQRLRPLTERLPKPLLPVAGKPIIAYTLDVLAELGVESCAINLHHLAEMIPTALGRRWRGMELVYYPEQQLLGTLGPLVAARDFLSQADEVVVVNGDSLCQWPIEELSRARRRENARVALLLAADADVEGLGGGLGLDRSGHVRRLPGLDLGGSVRSRVFAGAHVLDPVLLQGLVASRADSVRELYRPMIAAGEIIPTFTTTRRWDDLGTGESYRRGVVRRLGRGGFVAPQARVAPSARIVRSAVEAGAEVGPGVYLEDSLVLSGATITGRARVTRALVGFDARVDGSSVDGGVVL